MRRAAFLGCAAFVTVVAACGLDAVGLFETPTRPVDAGEETGPVFPPDGEPFDGGGGTDSGDSGCGDIVSDPLNCGACGHSCLDAGCEAGVCSPTLLGDQLSAPYGVVLVGGVAYVAEHNRGHIREVPFDGGPHTLYFNTGQAPYAIAAGPAAIYWGEQTKVRSKPFAVGTSTDLPLDGGSGCTVAVDGTNVYFGVCGVGDRVAFADLLLAGQTDLATTQDDPRGLAFDATHIYWCNTAAGTISRKPRAGGAVEILVSGETTPDSIVVDGTSVYWTVPGAIRRATIGGAIPWTASSFVSGEGRPRSIARDGTRLYWLDSMNSTLRRVDTATGASPITIASNEAQETATSVSTAITFDATYVYWVASTAGTLKRVPK